ncbi:MAG: deoxyribose-phosphate aldolase [Pirellulaceae bacterium]
MNAQYLEYAKMIDHSLLIPTMDERQLEDGCQLAARLTWPASALCRTISNAAPKILAGSSVQPSTTIGFPHGGHATAAKRFEAEQAIADGCQELDMVVNISQVLSGQWAYVTRDIAAVIEVAHAAKRRVKVIFENSYLQDEHKIRLCQLCSDLKADWVKTSTGYGGGGATIEDLKLMIAKVAPGVQVKAAGGVRDWATLKQVRALGVTRCGASRTQEILDAGRIEMGIEPIRFTPSASTAAGY